MSEYIEREAACAYKPPEKKERRYSTYNLDDAFEDGYDEHIKQVEAIPAADVVEVRHAYWRDIQPPDQDNNVQCWCSACGAGELHADGMVVPYCWKCGAKMDGGADE